MSLLRRLVRPQLLFRTRREKVDQEFYYRRYLDVAKSGEKAYRHYALHGWREGRNPSADFHTTYYAFRHLPNGKLCENPLAHFVANGGEASGLETSPETMSDWVALQKQAVSPYFDEVYYRKQYGEQLGSLAPIDHYFAIGWKTGCNPCSYFDSEAYLNQHAHVSQSEVNPLFHYMLVTGEQLSLIGLQTQGSSQRQSSAENDVSRIETSVIVERVEILRVIRDYVDCEYYKNTYKDVANANLNPLIHFADYGWREGRNPSETFHTRYYQARYGSEVGHDVNPLYHYAVYGRANGYSPNPIGIERWPRPIAPGDANWLQAVSANDTDADINIIIPVYRGYDDTLATIYSVLTQPQKTRYHLTVINDCSPDPRLTQRLRELASMSLFTYLENEKNLGFIGTVNKGIELLPDLDVILLNADTLVFGDWIDRMLLHAANDPNIGTITPYSNNATICSYPVINCDNKIKLECTLEQIDAYARFCNKGRATNIPTGVGFCFYIRRSVLSEVGLLDIAFGRGYGEENDLCMRIIKSGYKNILAEDIFVFHSGQVSFFEFSDEEFGPGQKLLISKHPDYVRRVAAFVNSDPGSVSRVRLDLYRLARNLGERVALLWSIDAGGGVETHVDNISRRLQASGLTVLIALVNGDRIRFHPFDRTLEIYTPTLKSIDLSVDHILLAEFLDWLQPTFIHVHSLALASWRAAKTVMEELSRHSSRLYVTLHDFDPLCFRYNMVDAEGRYCGEQDARQCKSCMHAIAAEKRCNPDERIACWHAFLKSARRLFVPSEDTRRRLTNVFPDVKFLVREHEEELDGVQILTPPAKREPLRLVAVGAIGPHKGSDLIYALALDAKERDLPIEYHIVGYTSIDTDIKNVGVKITGSYNTISECFDRIMALGPSFAISLSIWPETYLYTLSIIMKMGLPPIVFDIGAQADRVRSAKFGVILDPQLAMDPKAINDLILGLSVADEWAKVRPINFRSYENFPLDYYDVNFDELVGGGGDGARAKIKSTEVVNT